MTRIIKEPSVRINEILDAAERLFYSKGYDGTTVNDIVKGVGVAKGTFYNYFSSKERVLEALFNRHLLKTYHKIEEIADSDRIPPNKMELVVYSLLNSIRNGDGGMFDFLYNKHLHIIDEFIHQANTMFVPLKKKIIEEGNQQGYFKVRHIVEVLDFISSVLTCICHSLYQKHSAQQMSWRLEIAEKMLNCALGTEKSSLHLMV